MKKQSIALVFPESTFLIDPMVYPPLGLWYLAAHIEKLGHRTEFFDLSQDEFPKDGDFDQLWLSGTSPQMHSIRKYGQAVAGWTKTRTVLGGAAPWARPEECQRLGFGLVVAGEADYPELIEAIINPGNMGLMTLGTRLGQVPQLAPVRRWSHRYHAWLEDRQGVKHPTTTMFTSRGCPMACAFCESGRNGVIWDRFVRYEPIELVASQLREIRGLGYTGVMFYDDILPLNKPRTLQIMEALHQLDFTWRCFIRTDVVTKQGGLEYLRSMAEAGLVEVLAGVESADNRIKDAISKGTTIEQDTQVLGWCKELGIKFKASLILGLPGEDLASLEATRQWILTNRPDRVDVNTLIPFPGTPIGDGRREGGGTYDVYWVEEYPEEFWYKGPRDQTQAVVGTSSLTPEQIRDFHDNLIKEIEAEGIPY